MTENWKQEIWDRIKLCDNISIHEYVMETLRMAEEHFRKECLNAQCYFVKRSDSQEKEISKLKQEICILNKEVRA